MKSRATNRSVGASILVALALGRSASAVASDAPGAPPQSKERAGVIVFDDREVTVLRELLTDDLHGFTQGWKSIAAKLYEKTGNGPLVATADEIQRAYDVNEVAADQTYLGKSVIARGTVHSVHRGRGGKHYVTLLGGSNMFIRPNAQMATGHDAYLANLTKGQDVTLVCTGNHKSLGSAWLGACRPAADWITTTVNGTIPAIPGLVVSGNREMTLVAAMGVALAAGLPPDNPCWVNNACSKEFAQVQKLPGMRARVAKRLGINEEDIAKLFDK